MKIVILVANIIQCIINLSTVIFAIIYLIRLVQRKKNKNKIIAKQNLKKAQLNLVHSLLINTVEKCFIAFITNYRLNQGDTIFDIIFDYFYMVEDAWFFMVWALVTIIMTILTAFIQHIIIACLNIIIYSIFCFVLIKFAVIFIYWEFIYTPVPGPGGLGYFPPRNTISSLYNFQSQYAG